MIKTLANINPRKIAVFRALQLGDLLCAMPAIQSLKNAFPLSEITLIGLPWSREFVDRFAHCFSSFIEFPGFPGLPEREYQPLEILDFIKKIQQEKFDMVVQMHGNGSVINPLMQLFNARFTAGYYEENGYCPDNNFFMVYPEGLPEIKRHLKLMEFLKIPVEETDLDIPLKEEDEKELEELFRFYRLYEKKYVCVHSGARDSKKYWNPQNFASLADLFVEKGYKVVLTGTQNEAQTTAAVKKLMKHTAIDFTGKTRLGCLALLIKKAKMLLSNDTGVSHIATAVKTPSIIVFLASDPARWAPLNQELHKVILPHQAEDLNFIIKHTEDLLDNSDLIKNKTEIL